MKFVQILKPGRSILAMNRGSATLKAALYEVCERAQLVLSIMADEASGPEGSFKVNDARGAEVFEGTFRKSNPSAALELMFRWLAEHEWLSQLAAVGHRLVHGGSRYHEPQRINATFLKRLEQLTPLDPEHLPQALFGIRFVAKKFPRLPQVACFDTAFHGSMPQVARMYALPRKLYDDGIRRYGFHGLSYEYILQELQTLDGELARGRVIIAHLGNGASMVVVRDGKSVDTTMGFTPLEGLVMGTRSGDVDPGALLYLQAQRKIPLKELNQLLNKKSGLLGVSGTSGDMRELLETASKDPRAAEAVNLFCYRAKKYLGAYAAALGGLDVLVFTGGIGEHAPAVRERICDGLDFLGIQLDAQQNQANAQIISSPGSRVKVRVIQTNEDLMIVRHVLNVLGDTKSKLS
jgi:acetate kinase